MSDKMPMAEKFEKLVDVLMEKSNLPGALQCQVALANGAAMAGTLHKVENIPGTYKFLGAVRRGDARAGNIEVVTMYFTSELLTMLTLPTESSDQPSIVAPDGAPIVGGRRMQ